jgi:hypothetical protein
MTGSFRWNARIIASVTGGDYLDYYCASEGDLIVKWSICSHLEILYQRLFISRVENTFISFSALANAKLLTLFSSLNALGEYIGLIYRVKLPSDRFCVHFGSILRIFQKYPDGFDSEMRREDCGRCEIGAAEDYILEAKIYSEKIKYRYLE